MVSDYTIRNQTARDELSIWNAVSSLLPPGRKSRLIARVLKWVMQREKRLTHNQNVALADPDDLPKPGRWYDLGLENTIALLTNVGFEVIDPNVGASLRDPVIHFRKP
jgi:hypothetical protein